MSRKTILTIVMTIAMITVWNGWLLLDWKHAMSPRNGSWQNSSNRFVNIATSTEPKLWQDIKKTTVEEPPGKGFDVTFDQAVVAAEGTEVELPGVAFLLSSGLQENKDGKELVTEFLLLPGNGGVAWCCGLTPIPNHEFSVLVDCSDNPISASKIDSQSPAFFVNVKGRLQLQKDNSINSLYTLEEVTVEFINMMDVMPPDVMNACLNKPMIQ